jgi:bacterioferritin (cytochrome b1)
MRTISTYRKSGRLFILRVIALFEDVLVDEQEHVDYLEGQLHAIDEMGIENYLAQQLHKGEEEKE